MSLTNLQVLCLDRFANPTTRNQIFAALELLVADLMDWGVSCEIWIDGSFLTEKHDPDDADLTVVVEDDVFNSLDISLQDDIMANIEQKNYHPRLHTFVIITKPMGHPEFDVARRFAAGWAEWWQVARDGWLKGLAVIRLGGPNV